VLGAVQKLLNQSRCHLGLGLGWVKGSRWGANRHHLAAMWPVVKLLSPVVCFVCALQRLHVTAIKVKFGRVHSLLSHAKVHHNWCRGVDTGPMNCEI